MLRVLHIARTTVASSERKVALMTVEPDLSFHLVRPRTARGGGSAHGADTPVLRVPMWRRHDPHRSLYGTLAFGMRAATPDIIHAEEEPDSLPALQVCLAKRAFAPSARLLLHTWQNVRRPLRWHAGAVLRATLRTADAVLCASTEGQDLLRAQGFTGTTARILAQGVDLASFSPRPALRGPDEVMTVGYAGRLVPEKGIDTLVEAILLMGSPCQLTIVGDGIERSGLLRQARLAGLAGRVRFTGGVPKEQMAAELAGFDVLVLPSRTTPVWKEQFGRVLAEAMACGVPVVGSDSGAIPTVIGDAGLVFPEGHAGRLADCLTALRQDRTLRRELGRRGRERAVSLFSAERLASDTAAFYRKMSGVTAGASL